MPCQILGRMRWPVERHRQNHRLFACFYMLLAISQVLAGTSEQHSLRRWEAIDYSHPNIRRQQKVNTLLSNSGRCMVWSFQYLLHSHGDSLRRLGPVYRRTLPLLHLVTLEGKSALASHQKICQLLFFSWTNWFRNSNWLRSWSFIAIVLSFSFFHSFQ